MNISNQDFYFLNIECANLLSEQMRKREKKISAHLRRTLYATKKLGVDPKYVDLSEAICMISTHGTVRYRNIIK